MSETRPDLDALQAMSIRWRELGATNFMTTPPEIDAEYRQIRSDLLYAVPDLIGYIRVLERDNAALTEARDALARQLAACEDRRPRSTYVGDVPWWPWNTRPMTEAGARHAMTGDDLEVDDDFDNGDPPRDYTDFNVYPPESGAYE